MIKQACRTKGSTCVVPPPDGGTGGQAQVVDADAGTGAGPAPTERALERSFRRTARRRSQLALGVAAMIVGPLALSGCSRRAAGPAPAAADRRELRGTGAAAAYYPLAIGNRWTYRVELLGQKSERTVQIKAVEDGYYVDTAGGRLRADAQGIRDEARYLLQEPLSEGASWTNVVSPTSTERYKILKAGGACTVPAGTFEDCITVESSNRVDPETTLRNRVTFARGVGIVRIEVSAERQGQRTRQAELALKSYEVR